MSLIHQIPFEEIISYFRCILSQHDLPIISVGSGDGSVEYKLDQELKTDIICVDNSSGMFEDPIKYEFIKTPKYKTVEDLIDKESELVEKNILFINWPYPNISTYDLDSIYLLKPKFIIIVYDCTGGAGSLYLHKWFSFLEQDIPFYEFHISETKIEFDEKYDKKISYLSDVQKTHFDDMQSVLLLLGNMNLDVSNLNSERNIKKEAQECIIS